MSNIKSKNTKERAYFFSLKIINLVQGFPQARVYFVFINQLLKAATSVGANLVEAKASSLKRDFIKFYQIVLKTAMKQFIGFVF